MMEPSLLRIFLDNQSDHVPDDLRGIVDGNKSLYFREGKITASMQMAIHQIFNCPYEDSIKRMYFKSKAIELITHQLAQLVSDDNLLKKPALLRSDDIERIHEAKDILIRNMENPPSLLDLSRQVGLNDTKLKRGFCQVFGSSVFGYFRSYRLEQARQSLDNDKMNVTEIAYAFGYSSSSHFIKDFSRHFGTTPGVYIRERQQERCSFI